ncbi:MAG: polysaccharide pyruvyl transferase family protein [Firmicutes bacterium]|nr:polysaccharide pyruvyl transferase family protein [Bacillota bacterium]
MGQEYRKTVNNVVNLHYWSASKDEKKQNLGDYLSKVIVEYMLSRKGISLEQCVEKTKHLYAVGSILGMGWCNATVWGSGFIREENQVRMLFGKYLRKLDIRAVRGPKTKDELIRGVQCPEIYGDPVILLPYICNAKKVGKLRSYSFVRHHDDNTECANIINIVTTDYQKFVDDIVSSEKVISSSLHGIIIAEAYGIPAVLYLPERLKNQLFKFQDYYFGTGRYFFPVASSLEEALSICPIAPPDFSEQREQLINAFPYDLWD